jgi:hypothetical protein
MKKFGIPEVSEEEQKRLKRQERFGISVPLFTLGKRLKGFKKSRPYEKIRTH